MGKTAEKIRNAEETVSKAQSALDAAQTGLHAADQVVTKVDDVRSSTLAKVVAISLIALITFGVFVLMRSRKAQTA